MTAMTSSAASETESARNFGGDSSALARRRSIATLRPGSSYGQRQLDLGPLAGRRAHRRPAAVALHPPDDRLAHAAAVVGHAGDVEARPAVADEHLDLALIDLGVDVDGRAAAELRGVDHRLARGGDQRQPAL